MASGNHAAAEFKPALEASAGLSRDSSLVVQELDVVRQTGDEATNLDARLSLEGNLGDSFTLDVSYGVTDIDYHEVDEFDLNTQLLMSSFGYNVNGINLGLTAYRADSKLGGEDYLTLSSLAPNVSFFLGPRFFFQGGFASLDKEFAQNPAHDAKNHRAFANAYYFLDSTKNYFTFGYARKTEDADAVEYDYSGNEMELNWITVNDFFNRDLHLKLGVKVERRNYEPVVEEGIVSQRDDRRTEWLGELTLDISKHTFAGLSYRYSQNESSEDDTDYNQRTTEFHIGLKL